MINSSSQSSRVLVSKPAFLAFTVSTRINITPPPTIRRLAYRSYCFQLDFIVTSLVGWIVAVDEYASRFTKTKSRHCEEPVGRRSNLQHKVGDCFGAIAPRNDGTWDKKQKTPFQEFFVVGARGFEPPTSCTPCKRASRAAPRPDTRTYNRHVNLQPVVRNQCVCFTR